MRTSGKDPARVLFLGSSGKIGQALAQFWPVFAGGSGLGAGIWQSRPGSEAPPLADPEAVPLRWDILNEPAPDMGGRLDAIVLIAGVMGADPEALKANAALGRAARDLARRHGNPRLLAFSSQAVLGADAPESHEAAPCRPTTPYGRAKLEMEQILRDARNATSLRLGNVAGADSVFRAAARGVVTLDRFPDGRSARRSYIGPRTLTRVLARLLDPALALPPVLNLSSPGQFEMRTLLDAAGLPFVWRAAPPSAMASYPLDVGALCGLVDGLETDPDRLIAEVAAAGWLPSASGGSQGSRP